ncbi:MAG: FeoB-associated Cys-rich membrane protein [Aquirufa sp.]
MDMEFVMILLIFLAALFYLGRIVYLQFWGKNSSGCSKGCGSCQSISSDFDQKDLV